MPCGGGERRMVRYHKVFAEYDGEDCFGEKYKMENCNQQECTTTTTTTTPGPTTRSRVKWGEEYAKRKNESSKNRFRWGEGYAKDKDEHSECKDCPLFNPFAILYALLFL